MQGRLNMFLAGTAALLVALLAPGSVPARGLTSSITPCGVVHGPVWSVSSREHGDDWAIYGDRTDTVCADKQGWANRMGAPLARVPVATGASTLRLTVGGTSYACVLARIILTAVCLTGDGGPSSTGAIAIANPSENPYASAILSDGSGLLAAGGALPVKNGNFGFPDDSLDARPIGDPVCQTLGRTTWTVRGFGPTTPIDSGTGWSVLAPPGTCGLAGLQDVAQRAATKAYEIDQAAPDDATLFDLGDWHCVAARRHRREDGHVRLLGIPFAGCVRRSFPFGTEPGALSTFVVVPNARSAQDSPPPVALVQALRARGIAALVQYARSGEGTTWGQQPTWDCGVQLITGLPSSGGTAVPTRWSMATSGLYPCSLAVTQYSRSLAQQALESPGTAASLDRPVWDCSSSAERHVAVCTFDPYRDRLILRAFGRPSGVTEPFPPYRVAIVGGTSSAAQQDLAQALATGRA